MTTRAYRLTSAQRLTLADCVRLGLVGWLLTDPKAGPRARLIQGRATTMLGFGFSRFATLASAEFGEDYRPKCPVSPDEFPLSITEACALANDIELEIATPDQLFAAGLVAAHSPFAQPEVRGRDWRSYLGALAALGIDWMGGDPTWKQQASARLRPFQRAVAAAYAHAAE